MKNQDYTIRITANATAQEAFDSINNVTGWWTENLEGRSQQLNDAFTVRFGDVHVSTQKLVELVPNEKVVWLVTEGRLNFTKDPNEWTNTRISFTLTPLGDKTQIEFTHFGLTSQRECFDACSSVWGQYIEQSLLPLINTGKGKPTRKGEEM